MASQNLMKAINDQYNFELESGYAYMGMAAYFANESWDGFAHFMEKQYKEEYEHAMKFFEFLSDKGYPISLLKMGEPKSSFKSHLDVFKAALEHEQAVTKKIHKLYEMALEEKAYDVLAFLKWFLDEQVEEEATMNKIIDVLNRIKGSENSLYYLDKEMAKRD